VSSPSFTILNAYPEARIALYHFDWYRVTDVSELYESGLDEIIGEGITLIEWPERAPELWPQSCLHVTVRAISNTQREITLQPMGGFRHITLEENT
jgi:tRNA threonylcarbamoyl adenosine modification protein YjeE